VFNTFQNVKGRTGAFRPTAVALTSHWLTNAEGFRTEPYYDVNAYRVGYGSDTITLPDGSVQQVQPGTRVSLADAQRDLQRRLVTEFMPRAREQLGTEVFDSLTDAQQAGLVGMVYRYGHVPQEVRQGAAAGPAGIAAAMESIPAGGGGMRNKLEAQLMRNNLNFTVNGRQFLEGPAAPGFTAEPNSLDVALSRSRGVTQ